MGLTWREALTRRFLTLKHTFLIPKRTCLALKAAPHRLGRFGRNRFGHGRFASPSPTGRGFFYAQKIGVLVTRASIAATRDSTKTPFSRTAGEGLGMRVGRLPIAFQTFKHDLEL